MVGGGDYGGLAKVGLVALATGTWVGLGDGRLGVGLDGVGLGGGRLHVEGRRRAWRRGQLG